MSYKDGQRAYLSCIKNVATREILAYELSTSLSMRIVFRTLDKLEEMMDGNFNPEAMIHSEQGVYY